MLGIIGAMEVEVSGLKADMTDLVTQTLAGMEFNRGKLAGRDVVVVRSGVGKVNAAACTQILADIYHVDAVINTGVAGSLRNEIDIGDIVVSTDAVQHDMEATIFGYEPGEVPQLGRRTFDADEGLRRLIVDTCRRVNPDIHVFEGRVASGDRFVADHDDKERIREIYGGVCTEMEGCAIAQTAWLNGIPFVIVRAISDKADGSDIMDYNEFEKKAAEHCLKLTEAAVADMPLQTEA